MTPHPDWHARFEALLTPTPPTPHEASETPADGPRVLGGRAGWLYLAGCLLWLLIGGGIAALYVVTLLARMTGVGM